MCVVCVCVCICMCGCVCKYVMCSVDMCVEVSACMCSKKITCTANLNKYCESQYKLRIIYCNSILRHPQQNTIDVDKLTYIKLWVWLFHYNLRANTHRSEREPPTHKNQRERERKREKEREREIKKEREREREKSKERKRYVHMCDHCSNMPIEQRHSSLQKLQQVICVHVPPSNLHPFLHLYLCVHPFLRPFFAFIYI